MQTHPATRRFPNSCLRSQNHTESGPECFGAGGWEEGGGADVDILLRIKMDPDGPAVKVSRWHLLHYYQRCY